MTRTNCLINVHCFRLASCIFNKLLNRTDSLHWTMTKIHCRWFSRTLQNKCEGARGHTHTHIYTCISGLHPQSPRHFAWHSSVRNRTALLPQSRDCSYYVSRRILAHPPLCLQKRTDLCAQDFAHSPDLWQQPWLANVTCTWSWRLCGMNPAIRRRSSCQIPV